MKEIVAESSTMIWRLFSRVPRKRELKLMVSSLFFEMVNECPLVIHHYVKFV